MPEIDRATRGRIQLALARVARMRGRHEDATRQLVTCLELVSGANPEIEAQVQLSVDTSTILAASKSANFLACIGLSRMKCGVRFNTAARSPNDNRLKATVTFSIDQKWDKLLAFSISSISGSDVCGASGAPQPWGRQPTALETVAPGYLGKANKRARFDAWQLGRE